MELKKANKIFNGWKEYIEINDKLTKIFTSIPESFLPYPIDTLEEALNVVAEDYFNKGDYKTSRNIQEIMVTLLYYKDDNEAIKDISDNIILKNKELREAYIKNLKEARDSWAKFKQ
jgi:hypothetical protein